NRKCRGWIRIAVIGVPLFLPVPLLRSQEAGVPEPAVTKGNEEGEIYGPPPPPELTGPDQDDPEARDAWFIGQRTYPLLNSSPFPVYEDYEECSTVRGSW